jgi:thiol-disulfide isomerase/thioredoxin
MKISRLATHTVLWALAVCPLSAAQQAGTVAEVAAAASARMADVETIVASGERIAVIRIGGRDNPSRYLWKMAYEAPSKLRLQRFGLDVFADGQYLYSRLGVSPVGIRDYTPEYMKVEITGSLLEALEQALPIGVTLTPDVRALLSSDPGSIISEVASEHPATVVESEDLDGRPCWRIDAAAPGILRGMETPISIWIDQASGLVAQWLVDTGKANKMLAEGAGPTPPPGVSPLQFVQFGERATELLVDEPIDEELFTFVLNQGDRQVEFFAYGLDPEPERFGLSGEEAPDFELELLNGETFKLSRDGKDKVVVIDFWATWCPPCLEAMPHMGELAREMADKPIVFLGISVDDPAAHGIVPEVFAASGATYDCGIDTQGLAQDYDATALPCMVLVDKEGRVVGRYRGFVSGVTDRFLEDVLPKLMAGEEVDTARPRR